MIISLVGVELRIGNEWFELGLTLVVSLLTKLGLGRALPVGSYRWAPITAIFFSLVWFFSNGGILQKKLFFYY